MGYNQEEMAEGDRVKTAFGTKGHWEYKRLPFGLQTPHLPENDECGTE